ncbi:unnamed protein product [Cylicocyclus nassatus]|uniref:Uncharacterized protein n=1 Tax=Cylicocyclus nassatus TaxID=53992 RepID=A0AA36M465_CYLNA|nr:unnamed protein product [Cylicocyclus nassatus]
MLELMEKPSSSVNDYPERTLTLMNCSKIWPLDGPSPFVTLELNDMCESWAPRNKDNVHQQLTSLFRYILMRVTVKPEAIQKYAARVDGTSGRNGSLETLPEEVEERLKDFAEDMLGLGHDELFPGRVKDLKETEFFKSLGSTEKERCEYLKDLTRERREWRPIYFRCLQLALRDVRAYKYDTATKKWIKHNRQSKRSGADLEEGDAPPTRRRTDKNDYYEAETL